MTFKSLDEAITALKENKPGSERELDAFEYILLNGPPELKEMLHKMAQEACPVKPSGFDKDGNPYYALDDIAQGLGASREEILKNKRAFKHMIPVGEC